MDEGLASAEWFMCFGASVGSIKRRYGRTVELADAWRAICPSEAETILAPQE